MTIQKKEKVANSMNDKKFHFKPYYKSRKLENAKIPFNQRLPKPIADDLMQFFRDNDMTQTDGMTYIALEFLNNHSFERKIFTYSPLFITFKDHDIKPDDLILLGVLNGYTLMQMYEEKIINLDEKTDDENMQQNESDYLPISKIEKLKEQEVFFNDEFGFNHFHIHHEFDENVDGRESLFKSLESKYDRQIDDFYCFSFQLNNFLDVKSGGLYKALSKLKYDDSHQGIQILQDNDGKKYYVTYLWHLSRLVMDYGVRIFKLDWHSKDELFEIVTDSTNQKLKNFINKQDDFKEIRKDNVLKEIEDIDNQIRKLQERKDECRNVIDNIFDGNKLVNKMG